ncbi:hypothetical protein [Falsiphaeobacter marinintestinus]|uniref:hypothetical protein n=1 Tax=Falsiphaeobacter marinintestinus TaxID=1492905 RepID=UPI0011B769F4|nr:hypothetical protein [Phaeobacter marinintestinus]
MKRLAVVLILFVALAGVGKPSAAGPIPGACDVLEAIDMAGTLGADAAYVPGPANENKYVRMSLCSAETPDLAARMTLMVRENLAAKVPDATTLRAQAIDELRTTIGAAAVIEEIDLGDAAMWAGDISQLTVWHRAGRVMFIFSPTPNQDRAAAENAAKKVLGAFP